MRDRSRMLRVDLDEGSVGSEPIPDEWRRRFIGGKGVGARYLIEETNPGIDPLGPENPLLFLVGPLTGFLPGEPRYVAITKSPLTGTFLDSYSGGRFPGILAGALDDHMGILLTGRADRPVALVIEDGAAEVVSSDNWGADTVETSDAYPGAAVATIGQAGEYEVSFATIASDRAEHHAGRGGAGAVMGSKRLKSLVAYGEKPSPPPKLAALRERDESRYVESDAGRWQRSSGTVETVDFAAETGVLPSKGWRRRGFPAAAAIGIEAIRQTAIERETGDPIPGDFRIETDAGTTVPRGATAMTLGAGLGIESVEAVAELGDRCNRLGMDQISTGNTVALAILASESGTIDRDFSFGDPDIAESIILDIAERESELGDILADGVSSAAERLGMAKSIPTAKNLELPAYDPRSAPGMALAYATSDRGACHRRARPVERTAFEEMDPESLVALIIDEQNRRSLRWSLIANDIGDDVIDPHEWIREAAIECEDLDSIGERVWNLTRLFNVREGFDRGDDYISSMFGTDDVHDEAFERLLDTYYRRRGWTTSGIPTSDTLRRLKLHGLMDEVTIQD